MSDYVYTAKNTAGVVITGRVVANSKREALDAIHRLKLFPITVEDSEKGAISIKLFNRRVSDTQIAAALLQLADLMDNGVPVLHAFQILEKQTPNPQLKTVIKNIHDRISEGESVHSAFSAHSDVFNDLAVSVLRAGAEGAFFESSLRRVGGFLEQQAELKGKVIRALIYPMLIFFAGLTLVLGLLIFFVPILLNLYGELIEDGQSLPLITQSLVWMRTLVLHYGWYVAIGAVVLYFVIQGQLSTPWGIRLWDRFKMRLPLIGGIFLNGAVAQFCRILGTLLANGVPILKSLEISGQATGNSILGDAVRRSAESVSSGEPLSKPLSEAGIIPPQVMVMISVAEESNTLETVLVNTADSIERHTSRQLDMLVSILQPILLLTVGLWVFYIVIAILFPMSNLWKSL